MKQHVFVFITATALAGCAQTEGILMAPPDGNDAEPDPVSRVEIESLSCRVHPNFGVLVEGKFVVPLAVGQAFEVRRAPPVDQARNYNTYTCGAWRTIQPYPGPGGTTEVWQDFGCERTAGQPEQQTVGLVHNEWVGDRCPGGGCPIEVGQLPAQVIVDVLVLSRPIDGDELMNASVAVTCE